MGFLDETKKLLGIDHTLTNQTSLFVTPRHGIVIEGYKKIYELSSNKIFVLCEDGAKLEIAGEKLLIKEISFKELSINGTISSVTFS